MHFIFSIPLALLPTVLGGLNSVAQGKGLKYFGSATDNPELVDSAYVKILSDTSEFGQITVGNTQKWGTVEPSQDFFSYDEGDAVVGLAETNKQLVRCHNLCWYNQLPDWVAHGTWTKETLTAVLQNHITNEVTHYKGKCYAWDVVNEAFNDDGSYRNDVFYNIIGPEYIPIAYSAAAAADPSAKLYYNDYNIEAPGAKTSAVMTLIKSLQAGGIKIDGLGLQAHFIVGETPSKEVQTANLDSFTALGIEVAYTELDIRFSSLPPTEDGISQQQADYVNTVSACLAADGEEGCVGVTLWDYTDKYSWVPHVDSGSGSACPWDDQLEQKEGIYGAILGALGSG